MIELINLTKKYAGKKVVDTINLKISQGEVVGLLGPNGAGKTTTIRMTAGTLPMSSGEVLVENQNILEHEEVKKLIGYLPENNPLYENLTVEEFLNFWFNLKSLNLKNRSEVISRVIKALDLKEVYYRPITELSKGFKQRTGLAQALLADPKILLLDEPTEGLDPNQRREVSQLILGLGKERTVVICSHVLSEITRMCSRVVIINKGKVVADNTVENLTKLSSDRQVLNLIVSGSGFREELSKLPDIVEVEIISESMGKTKITIEVGGGRDMRSSIFKLAEEKNWELFELSSGKHSLEDVFTQLTLE